MSVLYDVPSIGSEDTQFGQRGPTCWYYASKMLLKFHHKLDNKKDQVYKQFKTLHTLRQVLSESGGDTADEVIRQLKQRGDKMSEYEKAIRFLKHKTRTDSQEKSMGTMQAVQPGLQKARIAAAIKELEKEENSQLSRLSLLTSFVPDAGFHCINREQYAKPADVVDLLARWGPFYTGGTVVATRDKIKGTGKLAGTCEIMSVEEFKPTGSHAIVVVGASDTTVYFKDPQQTNQIRSMELKTFHKGLDQESSDFLIAINCWEGWDADEAKCVHMQHATLGIPS